jgi:hypothetical protein
MRPKAIRWFEYLLFTAIAIDLVNNLASWSTLSAHIVAKGGTPNPAIMLLLALASPALGVAFWYLIARRGSNAARWIVTVLVVLGTIGFALTSARALTGTSLPMFVIAAFAELLKLAAVGLLFTTGAARWFVR